MDAAPLQAFLNAHGHPCGVADGIAGPKTWAACLDWLAGRDLGERGAALAASLAERAKFHEIDTPIRFAHFLAQAAHETAGFDTLVEYGGPTYCARYDGRKDLGNTEPGDGYRYRGRGIFQVTGRANYRSLGGKLGIDLEAAPDKAATPDIAVYTACLYWQDHHLARHADVDELERVTRGVNGGLNGLADRRQYLNRLKQALGLA